MEEKKSIGKLSIIGVVLVLVIAIIGIVTKLLGTGLELCFVGLLVWAKCYEKSMNPMDILKVWTGGLVGVLICVAEIFVVQQFGAAAGKAVLLVLVGLILVLDIGKINPWLANHSTAFFLTVALALSHFKTAPEILKDFGAGFLIGGVLLMIIATLLVRKMKKAAAAAAAAAAKEVE